METVRKLREERGWTQAQLAVYAGMGPAAISQIETGARSPNASTLQKLAKAFEVEIPDLFERTDTPKAQAPLPFDSTQESAERRLLKVLAGYKDLAKGLAAQVEALLTDVAERGGGPLGASIGVSVGTLLRSYCRLDDVIRAQLPEFLTDLSIPQAEYELAQETWHELDRINALFKRVHDELAKKGEESAGTQVLDELEAARRRRAEQGAAPERSTRREIS